MADHTERDALHDLIEICGDGERGFRAAADPGHRPRASPLFAELAEERHRFAADLVSHLHLDRPN